MNNQHVGKLIAGRRAVVTGIMSFFIASLVIIGTLVGYQVDIRDHGARSGQDCTAAFGNACLEAMTTDQSLYIPKGVWKLRAQTIIIPDGKTLEIVGDGPDSVLQRDDSSPSWTMRIRAGNDTAMIVRGVSLDGNRRGNPSVPGDDQFHEIRIDQWAGTMRFVDLLDVTALDLVADGVQFVHNGLEQVTIKRFEYIPGGSKGRRNIQFSYHPKSAIVCDSTFADFSTEPSGGTLHKCNLILQESLILNTLNIQRCGNLKISNIIVAGGTARISGANITVSKCRFRISDALFYGETVGVFEDCLFILPVNATGSVTPVGIWPRFTSHTMDITFRDCLFQAEIPTGQNPTFPHCVRILYPDLNQLPVVKIRFEGCDFDRRTKGESIYQYRGSRLEVVDCVLSGQFGITLNSRFSHPVMAELFELGNIWNCSQTLQCLSASNNNGPFAVELESMIDRAKVNHVPSGVGLASFSFISRRVITSVSPASGGGIAGDMWQQANGPSWVAGITSATNAEWNN